MYKICQICFVFWVNWPFKNNFQTSGGVHDGFKIYIIRNSPWLLNFSSFSSNQWPACLQDEATVGRALSATIVAVGVRKDTNDNRNVITVLSGTSWVFMRDLSNHKKLFVPLLWNLSVWLWLYDESIVETTTEAEKESHHNTATNSRHITTTQYWCSFTLFLRSKEAPRSVIFFYTQLIAVVS